MGKKRKQEMYECYLKHISASHDDADIFNEYAFQFERASEHFMRKIEAVIGVPEQGAWIFRQSVLVAVAIHGRDLDNADPEIKRAIDCLLFVGRL